MRLLLFLALAEVCSGAEAHLITVPPGNVEPAICQLVRQCGWSVIYSIDKFSHFAHPLVTHGIFRESDCTVGLRKLLDGLPLGFRRTTAHFISIYEKPVISPTMVTAQTHVERFDVPAGPANEALMELASQGQVSVLYDLSEIGGITTHAIAGAFNLAQALDELLRDTKLTYVITNGDFIAISVAKPPVSPPPPLPAPSLKIPPLDVSHTMATEAVLNEADHTSDMCLCAYRIEFSGEVTRGPWCRYADGRSEHVPERCPNP